MSYRSFLLTAALLLTCVPGAHAQDQLFDRPFENVYARPGRPTETIYVLGSVGNPGLWRIERGTDLLTLLSVAGLNRAGEERPDINQKVVLRVYRDTATGRDLRFKANLIDVLEAEETPPPIEGGDIIYVETVQRRRIGVRVISQVVGAVSSTIGLFLLLEREGVF